MTPQHDASTWLVSCSPERTLCARRESGDAGVVRIVKLFESGSLSSAQREMAFAQLFGGRGFAQCYEARRDPGNGKPSLVGEYYSGSDLLDWVTAYGPMQAADAAKIMADLADRLVSLESVRANLAPAGVVHRDIKPSNIVLHGDPSSIEHCEVIVLDFEHAISIRPEASDGPNQLFSGGSHGYSPPEAYRGSTPEPSFDIFGLGCTLQFLLTGSAAYRGADTAEITKAAQHGIRDQQALQGVASPLRGLIDDCLAQDPSARPKAAAIGTILRTFLATRNTYDNSLDRILAAIHAGELAPATAALAQIAYASRESRWHELDELLTRARSLLTEYATSPERDDVQGNEVAEYLIENAPRLAAFMIHFPAHPEAIKNRHALLSKASALLLEVPQLVAENKKDGDFDAAMNLIDHSLTAMTAIDHLGRIPVHGADGDQPPPPLQDPRRFLTATRRDLELSAAQHDKLLRALVEAETALDMSAAERALANFAKIYGGASRIVSDLKDRVHRLDFYLARIVNLAPTLIPLREQLELGGIEIALRDVDAFLEKCAKHMPEDNGSQSSGDAENIKMLHRYMNELISEYPHLQEQVDPAQIALGKALASITAKTWDLIASARKKLATPPIPIRPLQNILNQLDHFRLADMLIDQPQKKRAALLDQLEDLRMELDHARNARDRITRGVQTAIDEGHLTTALYELSRAVDRFDDGDDEANSAPAGSPLAHQFAAAKRRKQEIEEAQRKNHLLASQYARQANEEQASDDELLTLLQDRERTLQFLCASLGQRRAEMYAEDLQVVKLALMRKHASKGEFLVASVKQPRQRLVIAEQTLSSLTRLATLTGTQTTLHAEATALIQTWENIRLSATDELSDEAAKRRAEDRAARVQHKRWVMHSTAGISMLTIGIAVALFFLPSDSSASTLTTVETLQQRMETLRTDQAEEIETTATKLLSLLRRLQRDPDHSPAASGKSWLEEFRTTLIAFDQTLAKAPPTIRMPWRNLGIDLHRAGIDAISSELDNLVLDEHLANTRNLAIGIATDQK